MYKNMLDERAMADLQRQNHSLKLKLSELEAEGLEQKLRQKEVSKQVGELARSNTQLQIQFKEFQESKEQQVARLQSSIEQRSNEISIVKSQLSVAEQSNENLSELLRTANQKILQLMRELGEKNRFIKEYIERDDNN